MSWRLIEHPSRDDAAVALAARVTAALEDAIAARGRAGLAVPGGSTPAAFLSDLGRAPLKWERMGVTLTDERWVPVRDERSNQGMLSRTLFAGAAAAAEFVPLYGGTAEPAGSLPAIEAALKRIVLPLDAAVLGMGDDMHTASLFPGALGLRAAMQGGAVAAAIRAPGADEPRVTLTAPVLRAAGYLALLIHGPEKRAALDLAAAGDDWAEAPVRAILSAPGPVEVHWAP